MLRYLLCHPERSEGSASVLAFVSLSVILRAAEDLLLVTTNDRQNIVWIESSLGHPERAL
jgi:hypothetical protein